MVDSLWQLYDARGWLLATVGLTRDLLAVLGDTPSTPERAQQEIMLQTSLARALLAIKGYTPEVEQAYTRALTLCEGSGDIPQLFPVLRGLCSYYTYRAEFDKSAEMGAKIMQLAESQDDDNMRIHGYLMMGTNTGFRNDLELGLEYLAKGVETFEPEQIGSLRFRLGNHPAVVCLTTSAFFLHLLGYPDSALKQADEAMALARRLNHPFTLAYATFHTGMLHIWRREMAITEARALDLLEIAQEHDFQVWQAIATILHGVTLIDTGRSEEGLVQIERGLTLYQDHVTPPVFWPGLVSIQASALAMTGQPAAGLRLLEEELTGVDKEALWHNYPELGLIRGDLLLAVSPANTAEARDQYGQALEIAYERGIRMLELQVKTRLCRLAQLGGNQQALALAGRQLRECYDTFTEGFETADLLEARALLDELGHES